MISMTAELRTFVDIDATPERVWQVLMDLPTYPEWNPFVTNAGGTFEVGERLSFTMSPLNPLLRGTLRPTVVEVTPYRRLEFRVQYGKLGVPGLFGSDHTLTLVENEDGTVRLWEEVRFRGLLVPLVSRSLNRDSSPAVDAMNEVLKNRIERTQPAGFD
jgi:hypothetical protein